MKMDLSCPIELHGYALSFSGSGVQASVRLYNLSNRRIASFEAVAKWRSSAAGRSVAAPFCAERLRAGGESEFTLSLSTARLPEADQLELVFTSVRFEDGGPDWRAGHGQIVEVAPPAPIPSDELGRLRSAAGHDAICYPQQDADTWRCVCGRVNAQTDGVCARCRRDRSSALGHTPESVRADASQPTGDEAIAELQNRFFRQRARLLRRTVAMAVVALALTVLLVLGGAPAVDPDAAASAASVETGS